MCTLNAAAAPEGEPKAAQEPQRIEKVGQDFKIVKNEVRGGVRYVVAEGNPRDTKVCTQKMEIEIKGDRIQSLKFTGGCNGNLQAIGRLVKGMKVSDVIATLGGVNCGGRGTSCTDQLTRVLERL